MTFDIRKFDKNLDKQANINHSTNAELELPKQDFVSFQHNWGKGKYIIILYAIINSKGVFV